MSTSSQTQAKAKEQLLKKIRNSCDDLLINANDQEALKNIKSLIDKGLNYSFYVLSELLDFQAKNADSLSSKLSNVIFDLIELALFTNKLNGDQNVHLIQLTNSILKNEEPETVVGRIINIFLKNNGKNVITISKPELMFELSEVFFSHMPTTKTEPRIDQILMPYIKSGIQKDGSLQKILKSIRRSARTLALKKRWNDVEDLLKLIVVEVSTYYLKMSDDLLQEFVDYCIFFVRYAHSESGVMETTYELTTALLAIANPKSNHHHGFVALEHLIQFSNENVIDADLLNNLCGAFKNLDKKESSHQKIARALTKIAANHSKNLSVDEESFKAFHTLSVAAFHILASIKNESGVFDCCVNIKRHEVASLIVTLMTYAMNMFKNIELSNSSSHNIIYHLSYFIKIMSEIDCKTKDSEMKQMYIRVYNLLYDLSSNKLNVKHIIPIVEQMFSIIRFSSEESRATYQDPFSLIFNIFEDTDGKELALECASGMASLMNYMMNSKKQYEQKILMKVALQVNQSAVKLGYSSGTDFIKGSEHRNLNFFKESKIEIDAFTQLEICSLTRYTDDCELSTKLFNSLCEKTDKPENLANCMYLLDDKNMEGINMPKYMKLLKDLEDIKDFNIEFCLALAVGHYNVYSYMDSNFKKHNKPNSFESMNLKKELEMLEYLIKAQQYFTDIIVHVKSDPQQLKKIISIQRITSIINNMAIQFYMRGVKLKEIETFTILWHFSHLDTPNPTKVLNTATFFIDNYQCLLDTSGNYLKFSKKLKPLTIEEIIVTASKIVAAEIEDFRTASEDFQCLVLSYLISTWLFYFKKMRKADAMEQFKILKDLWKKSSTPHTSDSRNAVNSKLYFSLVDANLVNFNRSADNFMSRANGFLMNAKNIRSEFSHQFYQIFYRVTMSNINYSLNRHNDLDHYEVTIQSMIMMAQKKNYCLKVLELLSLTILRYLNMEKIDVAQNQLRNISIVLGLKEDILIESPQKNKTEESIFVIENSDMQFVNETEGMRKAVVSSDSPIDLEYSIRHVNRSDLLSIQLKSFVHEETCKCETCRYPQLKFYSFQIGCFYSRLMFLMKKLDVSVNFHKFSIEPWRNVCDKLRRIKEFDNFLMINKSDFHVFSIRWLFQFADSLIQLKEFEPVQEVYQEIDLLLTNNIHDSECFKQALFCRKENLNFLMENYNKKFKSPVPTKQLSFTEFIKLRKKPDDSSQKTVKIKSSAIQIDDSCKSVSKTPAGHIKIKKVESKSSTTSAKSNTKKTTSPIYVYESDEEESVNKHVPSKSVKKPSTSSASSISSQATPVASSSSKSSKSSTAKNSTSTAKSSRTKSSDQTPVVKKSSKEDKSEEAKKNLRRRMI